jgi:autotransporter-associated beta strand protein
LDTNSYNATINQAISGNGNLIKTGSGALLLAGSNIYSGTTTVNQGTLQLTGGAKAQLDRITPAGHTARIQLTITDDFPYAQAVVIIEAVAVS